MLAPGTSFLDIGCGSGRVARYLLDKRIKTYWFDRHRDMVNGCSQEISNATLDLALSPPSGLGWFMKSSSTAVA
jgi:cyclopropane fatty-acyl-phospholipid synthase-like methyltransferase